jgi:hypothetical protein
MRIPARLFAAVLCLAIGTALFAMQGRFRRFQEAAPPPGGKEKTEWAFARLHWYGTSGYHFYDWWAMDYPKADRQFTQGVQRLTRVHARSMEQVVDINSDEVFDWPWIYVELAGRWTVTEDQAGRLRKYLLRGGFLMIDNMHGDYEWQTFEAGMRTIFPDRQIEDLSSSEEIYHVLYDLDERLQVPRISFVGTTYPPDAKDPRWRGIRDDKGRIMVAISHNSDVGDAWEWADVPEYPEKFASFAYRLGINYLVYDMTH